ncbi:MAG TPA: sugar phosphate isomerase/epimerase [Steroidobacteraceae bacterium]|nr:sugar phosphate isomerase/epimerase [Steroidobacteraceae bacterium]
MQRRDFLKRSAATLAAAGAVCSMSDAGAEVGRHRPLGLQLYTVMPMLEKDFSGTLAAVAKMGYREVETIGSFGRDPSHVRELFHEHGLVSPSQHMVPGDLYKVFQRLTQGEMSAADASRHWREVMSFQRVEPIMEECIPLAHALGQKYIVWQILWEEQMRTRADLEQFCKALNTAGRMCRQEGLVLNYHNHAAEFSPHDGVVPYDFVLANTDPELVKLELDLFWAVKAGADPRVYFKNHPGRYRQCHLKDGTSAGQITTVGEGMMRFQELIPAARKAGIEHYYVEQDGAPEPMKASAQAFDFLSRWF